MVLMYKAIDVVCTAGRQSIWTRASADIMQLGYIDFDEIGVFYIMEIYSGWQVYSLLYTISYNMA